MSSTELEQKYFCCQPMKKTEWMELAKYWGSEKEEMKATIQKIEKILAQIVAYPEYQGFMENDIIPCQAPCARQYEDLCRRIQELNALLSSNNTQGEKKL